MTADNLLAPQGDGRIPESSQGQPPSSLAFYRRMYEGGQLIARAEGRERWPYRQPKGDSR